MRLLTSLFASLLLCASCADKYSIAGNSSVPTLDGRMLYLCINGNNAEMVKVNIDSCEVMHGKFNFIGFIDSCMMAELCVGDEHMMPLVLEKADIKIHVDHTEQRVTGGPLNERLYNFIKKRNRLENDFWELQQTCIRMMRGGETAEQIHKKTAKKRERLISEIEALETQFVMDNYENVLGPNFFISLTKQYQHPILTPQLRNILQMAPPIFMEHPHVINFIEATDWE